MTPLRDRLGVLAGVGLVLVLAYLVLLHWWFTAPMLRMGDEIARLRDEEQALRMEIQQRPALELELARVRAAATGNDGFLPESNVQLASAALVQRLESVVAATGKGCRINTRTPTSTRTDEPFQRAAWQVGLTCGTRELGEVLHALESGEPQLFIDKLDVLARTAYLGAGQEGSGVDVNFELYGYLKVPAAPPAEAGR